MYYSYSAVIHRLRFMASKPHHLLPLPNSAAAAATTTTTLAAKRARTMTTDSSSSSSSPIKDAFTKYTQYLNTLNEKRERVVKASRDITINSKKVQEYIEAATFCSFCKSGYFLTLDEINATLLCLSDPSLEPLQINVLDYLLGLADLTGELMRLAIGRISEGELQFAEKICRFVCDIYRELTLLVPHMDDSYDIKTKMDTMLQSVMKIENGFLTDSKF
nr:translin-associated protein x [Quercus suber]